MRVYGWQNLAKGIHDGVEFPHNPWILGTTLFHSSWEPLVCNVSQVGPGWSFNWATPPISPTEVKESQLYYYQENQSLLFCLVWITCLELHEVGTFSCLGHFCLNMMNNCTVHGIYCHPLFGITQCYNVSTRTLPSWIYVRWVFSCLQWNPRFPPLSCRFEQFSHTSQRPCKDKVVHERKTDSRALCNFRASRQMNWVIIHMTASLWRFHLLQCPCTLPWHPPLYPIPRFDLATDFNDQMVINRLNMNCICIYPTTLPPYRMGVSFSSEL